MIKVQGKKRNTASVRTLNSILDRERWEELSHSHTVYTVSLTLLARRLGIPSQTESNLCICRFPASFGSIPVYSP